MQRQYSTGGAPVFPYTYPQQSYYMNEPGYHVHPQSAWAQPQVPNGVPFPRPIPIPANGGAFSSNSYSAPAPPDPSPPPRPVPQLSRHRMSSRTGQPLKPALKNPERSLSGHSSSAHGHRTPPPPPPPRSRSSSLNRPPINGMTRQRTNSMPRIYPEHLYLSFHGSNELRLENVAYQPTVDQVRENVLHGWPHGIETESSYGHTFRAAFRRQPWKSSGKDALFARRMICNLFAQLAHEGYNYLTTIDAGHITRPPRLVFAEDGGRPDRSDRFFSVAFSRSGRRVSVVDAPGAIKDSIGTALRNVFPRQIAMDKMPDDTTCIIEIHRPGLGRPGTTDLFAAYILLHINSHGWTLEASVPLARRGPFGMSARKELWIFRSSKEA